MILKPRLSDVKVIGLYTGKIVAGSGFLMLLPFVVALIFKELNPAFDFVLGMLACFIFGLIMHILCRTDKDLSWRNGMVVAAVSWIFATLLGAIPHYLSGHFGSFIDAVFDVMSGYTTTGLYLIQDLDHVSYALNTWRHVLSYAGGQGIIVIALTFMIRGTAGAFKIYVGEAKEEKLLPNVIQTARAIWIISLTYLVVGTLALWASGVYAGMPPVRGFLHGLWVFMASWSTGGFGPQSYNIGYYNSIVFEAVTIVILSVGSFNFALHWAVWTGNRREIYKNIEIRAFFTTLMITLVISVAGLIKMNVYPEALATFRRGFFHVMSGHTGTGFMTVYTRELVTKWGELAMLGLIIAMTIGGSAASTCGGFKELRVGILFNAFIYDLRKLLSPESSVIIHKIHHIKDIVLEERHVRSAALIVFSYILIYALGSVVGRYYGYPLTQAIFDSVSAASNTGLSCGVTSPFMPAVMKVVYIFEMWAGRLEFVSIFALIGFIIAAIRGK